MGPPWWPQGAKFIFRLVDDSICWGCELGLWTVMRSYKVAQDA